jgi:hypothetical protein
MNRSAIHWESCSSAWWGQSWAISWPRRTNDRIPDRRARAACVNRPGRRVGEQFEQEPAGFGPEASEQLVVKRCHSSGHLHCDSRSWPGKGRRSPGPACTRRGGRRGAGVRGDGRSSGQGPENTETPLISEVIIDRRSMPQGRPIQVVAYFVPPPGPCLRINSIAALSSGSRPTPTSLGVSVFQFGSISKTLRNSGNDSSTRLMLTRATACQ